MSFYHISSNPQSPLGKVLQPEWSSHSFTDFDNIFKAFPATLRDCYIYTVELPATANVKLDEEDPYRSYAAKPLLITGGPVLREEAVRQNGMLIAHIPEDQRCFALCRQALINTPYSLQFMNQDEDLCVYALLQATEHWITSKNRDYMLNLFKLIKVRTEQVKEMALCIDGRILQFIGIKEREKRERDKEDKEEKEEERFVRFCKIAVENTPAALQWIPYPIQRLLGDDCLITSLARDGNASNSWIPLFNQKRSVR